MTMLESHRSGGNAQMTSVVVTALCRDLDETLRFMIAVADVGVFDLPEAPRTVPMELHDSMARLIAGGQVVCFETPDDRPLAWLRDVAPDFPSIDFSIWAGRRGASAPELPSAARRWLRHEPVVNFHTLVRVHSVGLCSNVFEKFMLEFAPYTPPVGIAGAIDGFPSGRFHMAASGLNWTKVYLSTDDSPTAWVQHQRESCPQFEFDVVGFTVSNDEGSSGVVYWDLHDGDEGSMVCAASGSVGDLLSEQARLMMCELFDQVPTD